jgi:uncharacterized membrane protein YqaE (UPF0057 family)
MEREGSSDFVRILVAYFLPPVGVFLQTGVGLPLLINIVLTLLLWLPGVLHAVWVIASVGKDGEANPNATRDFTSLVAAALLPPVGVFLKEGMGAQLIINCVLTFFFWIPGTLHAVWVITQPED